MNPINVLKLVNEYFQIPLWYLRQKQLAKLIIGAAKRSGKSYGVATLIVFLMITDCYNVVCFRKNSSKIKESVFTEIVNAIDRMGLRHLFKISMGSGDFRITYIPWGNQVVFKGINAGSSDGIANASVMGSFNFFEVKKGKKAKLVAWFEEAFQFTDDDIKITMMSYPSFDETLTIMTFNNWAPTRKIVKDLDKYVPVTPEIMEENGVQYHYLKEEDGIERNELYMRMSSWTNKEHLNKDLLNDFLAMKKNDPDRYNNVVLGMSGVSGDLTYTSFDEKRLVLSEEDFKAKLIEQGLDFENPEVYRIGIDYGRHRDYNAFVFKKSYGVNQDIQWYDKCYGFTNLDTAIDKDVVDITYDAINFIKEVVRLNPLIKGKKMIIQVDSSADGLLDLLRRYIINDQMVDEDGWLMSQYLFILPSWKDKIMSRVHYDNWLMRHDKIYYNRDYMIPLINEIKGSRKIEDNNGKYKREDLNDHYINAGEYTNTKSDRRRQFINHKEEISSTTDLDLEIFKGKV